MATFIPKILSRWNHNIDGLKFSSQEFYSKVDEGIKRRNFPDVSSKRISLSQGGLFSSNREYLRVWRGDLTFDICAAPFGDCFFVSWWFGERLTGLKALLARIPYIGPFIVNVTKPRTYYQLDTQNMFTSSVHTCVLAAIEEVSTGKGIRSLSDTDRLVQGSVRGQS